MPDEPDTYIPWATEVPISELLLKILGDSIDAHRALSLQAKEPLPEAERAVLLEIAERYRAVSEACFAAKDAILAVADAQQSLDEVQNRAAREFPLLWAPPGRPH